MTFDFIRNWQQNHVKMRVIGRSCHGADTNSATRSHSWPREVYRTLTHNAATTTSAGVKVRTSVKGGKVIGLNHNQAGSVGLKVRTSVKAGTNGHNHNQTESAGLKVRTS